MHIVQPGKPVSLLRRMALILLRQEHRYVSTNASLPLSSALERIKKPTRGGQNLTERHKRLANSVRGKDSLSAYIQEQNSLGVSVISDTKPSPLSLRSGPITFEGFTIPTEPKEPASDECCMSGCAVCVYDLYHEALTDYNTKIIQIQSNLSALHIPRSEWPPQLQRYPLTSDKQSNRTQDASMSAFEALEMKLKAKHSAQNCDPAPVHSLLNATGSGNTTTPQGKSSRKQKQNSSVDEALRSVYDAVSHLISSIDSEFLPARSYSVKTSIALIDRNVLRAMDRPSLRLNTIGSKRLGGASVGALVLLVVVRMARQQLGI